MAVFLGLLRVVQNDDQLAAVISHETAHALAHHVSERVAHSEAGGSALAMLRAKPSTASKRPKPTTSACF